MLFPPIGAGYLNFNIDDFFFGFFLLKDSVKLSLDLGICVGYILDHFIKWRCAMFYFRDYILE